MSSNSFNKLDDQEQQQNPGPDPAIEREVKKEVDATRNILTHISDLVEMLSDFFTGLLGGTTVKEKEEEGERDFRADKDNTPQGTGKSDT